MSGVLTRAVADVAARHPGKVAVRDVDGTDVTYGELVTRVERLAAGLHARGVREGDTVAFALPNSARYVALILALASLGARYVPLMGDFTPEETARALDQARPVLLVAARPHHAAGAVPEVAPEALEDASAPPAPVPPEPYAGLFRQLWTSGSTGFPKMMVWRQDRFVTERRRWLADTGMTDADTYYCRHPLDVAHATDLHVFAALLGGARLVLADPAAPAEAHLERLRAERATVMSALPGHYADLVGAAVRTGDRGGLPELRRPLCGGAYLPPAVVRDADEVLGVRIRQIYGSTEFGIALGNMADQVQTSGAMVPVRGVGARVAPLSDRAPDTGELVLRSDCTSEGYLFADEANARTFRDGEFWTGDVAERLPGGAFRIVGRVTEVLATPAGPLLAPVLDAEIADACPGTAAVSLPLDPGAFTGRVAVAVRPAPDAAAQDVVKQVETLLAGHGLDGSAHVVDAIPRTPVGKVDKPRLRTRLGLAGKR